MQRFLGSRGLLAICGTFILLMGVLAVLQYRWSARVAEADAQREREHLDSAAALFANEFNGMVEKTVEFMQNDAVAAFKSGEPLGNVPPIIGELYHVTVPEKGGAQAHRLASDGRFLAAPLPDWFTTPHCASLAFSRPPVLVSPILNIVAFGDDSARGKSIVRSFERPSNVCFAARLNERYLKSQLLPQLIAQSFGNTASREYDFSVVPRGPAAEPVYGNPIRPDLRKPFFSIAALIRNREADSSRSMPRPISPLKPPDRAFFVERFQSTLVGNGEVSSADLLGEGVWELEVAHKGMPLAAAFERMRRRDLLLGLAVEALLIAAIAFLIASVRRMQKLADQKMQFVAAVSHELRTPVSAISMLSKNQADGLVTGSERVKQYGELIHQESRRLSEMVEQTLQFAGIHSGLRRRSSQAVDLRRLLLEAVDAHREELARRGFEIEMAISADLPSLFGDCNLLRTGVDNLLSNAEKYSDGGRWIRVSARFSEKDKEILISVEDRGPGIDLADQAEIFEPFARGSAALAAQIPGSGLGLSLVRSAAEAHHGSVTLVSEPGRGSTFTLHLPV